MSNHREREFFMERTLIYTADNSIVSMPVSRFLKQKGFSSQNLVQLKKDPSAVLANGIPCFMNRGEALCQRRDAVCHDCQ